MKSFCNKKGITMVSLIITIIVMLILAGVTITITLNADNGIIKKTKDATTGIQNFSLYESISEIMVTSKKKDGTLNSNTFPSKVNNIGDEISCSYNEETSKYTVTLGDDEIYEISEYGKITEK